MLGKKSLQAEIIPEVHEWLHAEKERSQLRPRGVRYHSLGEVIEMVVQFYREHEESRPEPVRAASRRREAAL